MGAAKPTLFTDVLLMDTGILIQPFHISLLQCCFVLRETACINIFTFLRITEIFVCPTILSQNKSSRFGWAFIAF
ncbi:hypothetical protein FKM82_009644 [Ascaphus truei]